MQYHEQCGPPNFFESLRPQEKEIHATIVSDGKNQKTALVAPFFCLSLSHPVPWEVGSCG
ncbi:hypothetical protein [Agrobacterium cavarae]|uniref:hypothetical protein n=1 Tax=Agrobacterium cavarae TaxID=2528239 RepID=UPI003D053017